MPLAPHSPVPHRARAAALVVLLTGLAACASSSDTASDRSSTSAEAACGQYFDALSQQDASCNALGIASASLYKAADKPLFVKQCALDLAAPGTSASPSFLGACAAAMQSTHQCEGKVAACQPAPGGLDDGAACSKRAQCKGGICKVSGAAPNGDPSFCGRCATGAALGGACTSAADCARPLLCVAGTCGNAPPPVLEGGSCGQKDASGAVSATLPCAEGLFCNTLAFGGSPGELKSPVCEKLRAKGEACILTECAVGLRCSEGACIDPRDARDDGGACARAGDCKSGYCDRATSQCRPIATALVGAACSTGVRCADGLSCVGATAETAKCTERLPEGASCSVGAGAAPCATNTACRDGVCQLNDPALCR